jgi:hypothetical protein
MTTAPATKDKVSTPPSKPKRCTNTPSEIGVKRRFLFLKANPGHTVDDIRTPDYLGIHAPRYGRHDVVTVLLDDESQEIELCIERVTQDAVYTTVRKVYSREDMGSGSTVIAPNFRTERAAGKGWCVVRISDGCAVITGHNHEDSAIAQWHREQPRRAA